MVANVHSETFQDVAYNNLHQKLCESKKKLLPIMLVFIRINMVQTNQFILCTCIQSGYVDHS